MSWRTSHVSIYIGLSRSFLQLPTILYVEYIIFYIITFILVIFVLFFYFRLFLEVELETEIYISLNILWIFFSMSLNCFPQNLFWWLFIVQWFSKCGLQTFRGVWDSFREFAKENYFLNTKMWFAFCPMFFPLRVQSSCE